MFFSKKPNREVYSTPLWRSINPIDRAHILLVAEKIKPAAYCGFTDLEGAKEYLAQELNVFIVQMRGHRTYERGDETLVFPHRIFTICASQKIFQIYQKLSEVSNLDRAYDVEGKLLGYPRCCRKEYIRPTYQEKFNQYILRLIRGKLYTFKIECVQRYLEGKEIQKEFLYLMPTQTPHSVDCSSSIGLLSKWKYAIDGFDPKAAKALVAFNQVSFNKFKEQADYLKSKGVASEQFNRGYIFNK